MPKKAYCKKIAQIIKKLDLVLAIFLSIIRANMKANLKIDLIFKKSIMGI